MSRFSGENLKKNHTFFFLLLPFEYFNLDTDFVIAIVLSLVDKSVGFMRGLGGPEVLGSNSAWDT